MSNLITQTKQLFFRPYSGWLHLYTFILVALTFTHNIYAGTPIVLTKSFAGKLDFVVTGGTFRLDSNDFDSCSVGNNSNANISAADLPISSTVKAAYLYWSGSYSTQAGSSRTTPDYNISLNGQGVTADQQFTDSFYTPSYDFFSGIADVTDLVKARSSISGNYQVSNLSVNSNDPHCNLAVVVAGWSLVVVYEDASEPLRVVNFFEGFQNYRGSQIVLSPDNFQTPASPSGKHAHITWDGDESNSSTLNGYSEELRFQGSLLTEFGNPANNQFNSYSSAVDATTYGVDIDVYDITPYLSPGLTSVTTTYSSGADRVLLSAEIISVENTPVADLAIGLSNSGNLVKGQAGILNITVNNLGPSTSTGQIDTVVNLPADLTYQSASGGGWSCDNSTGTLNCSNNSNLNSGSALPDLNINVLVANNAPTTTNVSASVAGQLFDNQISNNTTNSNFNIFEANISTSNIGVTDLNGGDVEPGDVLRYNIVVTESAGYPGGPYQLSGSLPSIANGFSLSTLPSGTNNSLAAPAGSQSTGLLDIINITINANGQLVYQLDVTVGSGIPGDSIDFSIDLSGSPLTAPTLIFQQSQVTASGNKPLYLDAGDTLNRLAPTSNPGAVLLNLSHKADSVHSWTQTPAFQSNFSFDSSATSIPLKIWLRNNGNNNRQRTLHYELKMQDGTVIAQLDDNLSLNNTWIYRSLNLPIINPAPIINSGQSLILEITNTGDGRIRVNPLNNGQNSQIILPATTVINVDSITTTDDSNAVITEIEPLQNLNISAIISDPFGSFDITNALLTLTDALGQKILDKVSMTMSNDSGAAIKSYTAVYALPIDAPAGQWQISIEGIEGLEGLVSHTRNASINVLRIQPNIQLVKSSTTLNDPLNGTTNPSRIPGAEVQYELVVTNSSAGYANKDSTVITDVLPNNSIFYVGDYAGAGLGPLIFIDGASGLTYNFLGLSDNTDALFFSTDGSDFSYSPTADADGYDTNVTHIRVQPAGVFTYSDGSSTPQFELRFKAKIQ